MRTEIDDYEEIACPAHPIFPIVTLNKKTKELICAICADKDKDNG